MSQELKLKTHQKAVTVNLSVTCFKDHLPVVNPSIRHLYSYSCCSFLIALTPLNHLCFKVSVHRVISGVWFGFGFCLLVLFFICLVGLAFFVFGGKMKATSEERAHSLRVQSITLRESQCLELEPADLTAPTIRKKKKVTHAAAQLAFSTLSHPGPRTQDHCHREWSPPTTKTDLPISSNVIKKTLN